VLFFDKLPLNAASKVLKRELAQIVQALLASSPHARTKKTN